MLNPCIWSSYFVKLPIEEAMRHFIDCGFNLSELSDEHAEGLLKLGNPEKIGSALKTYADNLGFRFPQGHLKLRANICGEDSAGLIDELKGWLDLFNAVGIKSAVLHSGYIAGLSDEELLEKRVESLSQLTDYIKDTDMTICLENLSSYVKNYESLLQIIEAVGSDKLGVCLDTGHLNISKSNGQYEFITKAGFHLKALHIADNEGERDQHLMPYGKGNVNWSDVLRGLKDTGYGYAFNFEIPGETQRIPFEILKNKLVYVRKMVDFMTAETE